MVAAWGAGGGKGVGAEEVGGAEVGVLFAVEMGGDGFDEEVELVGG